MRAGSKRLVRPRSPIGFLSGTIPKDCARYPIIRSALTPVALDGGVVNVPGVPGCGP